MCFCMCRVAWSQSLRHLVQSLSLCWCCCPCAGCSMDTADINCSQAALLLRCQDFSLSLLLTSFPHQQPTFSGRGTHGVRNNNPAKVIWINACDGLLLLPQSSQIIQHMYSVHTAGQETTNANNATVRHSLTAVQSSWPVFVLSVNHPAQQHLHDCMPLLLEQSTLGRLCAAVCSHRCDMHNTTFRLQHEDPYARRRGQCEWGRHPTAPDADPVLHFTTGNFMVQLTVADVQRALMLMCQSLPAVGICGVGISGRVERQIFSVLQMLQDQPVYSAHTDRPYCASDKHLAPRRLQRALHTRPRCPQTSLHISTTHLLHVQPLSPTPTALRFASPI